MYAHHARAGAPVCLLIETGVKPRSNGAVCVPAVDPFLMIVLQLQRAFTANSCTPDETPGSWPMGLTGDLFTLNLEAAKTAVNCFNLDSFNDGGGFNEPCTCRPNRLQRCRSHCATRIGRDPGGLIGCSRRPQELRRRFMRLHHRPIQGRMGRDPAVCAEGTNSKTVAGCITSLLPGSVNVCYLLCAVMPSLCREPPERRL